jgi:hypothetical protein
LSGPTTDVQSAIHVVGADALGALATDVHAHGHEADQVPARVYPLRDVELHVARQGHAIERELRARGNQRERRASASSATKREAQAGQDTWTNHDALGIDDYGAKRDGQSVAGRGARSGRASRWAVVLLARQSSRSRKTTPTVPLGTFRQKIIRATHIRSYLLRGPSLKRS